MQMKELLAELAMVEGEITRLESQISQLQVGLKHEQEAKRESKSRQWQSQGTPYNPVSRSSVHFTLPSPMNNVVHERMTFETKALHFISKAIKGDYTLSDFSLDEKKGNLRGLGDQKENYFNEEKFQDKAPKKSGILKSASPLRDPRNPSPKVCPSLFYYCYILFLCHFILRNETLIASLDVQLPCFSQEIVIWEFQ